jgi:hypothetical protein
LYLLSLGVKIMQYQIGDINRLSGRTTEMIRRAEREGLIPQAQRSRGGWRYWREADLPAIYAGLHVKPPTFAESLSSILEGATLSDILATFENLAPAIAQAVETLQGDKTLEQVAEALRGKPVAASLLHT